MLRKIIILAVCLTGVVAARADEKSAVILNRVASTLKGYVNYEVLFTASATMMDDVVGSYTVSGDRFSITVAGQTHFSDGKSRYEIYEEQKEVVIDNADLTQRNIFTNPARAFEFAADDFESTYKGTKTVAGQEADHVELVPLRGGYVAGTVITVYVSKASGLPVAVTYDYDGESIDISIDAVKRLQAANEPMFTFDAAKYGDYEIIDFR